MKITILITVPGEPVAQGRPRFARRGGFIQTYDPKESKTYKEYVQACAKATYQWPAITGAVRMKVDIIRAIPKSFSKKKRLEALDGLLRPVSKPDTDNYVKAVADALNGVCYADDSQIVSVVANKWYGLEPRIEVEVEEL